MKTRTFARDNKNKCQIKTDHSLTRWSLVVSAILFWNLCQLCQISSGRDGTASKIRRHPIEHTGIALPILAALPLAQTNRLNAMFFWYLVHSNYRRAKHQWPVLTLSQTINFRLLQTGKLCRRQFQTCLRWQEVLQEDRKHWEKEKLLVTSISPFPTVFSNGLYWRHLKTRACLGKVKI